MHKSCPASAAREVHDIMTPLYHLANSVELGGILHDYEDDEFKSKSIRRSPLFIVLWHLIAAICDDKACFIVTPSQEKGP